MFEITFRFYLKTVLRNLNNKNVLSGKSRTYMNHFRRKRSLIRRDLVHSTSRIVMA